MTIKQFKDMLYALKIQISPPEMQLIINKFIAYSYMIDKNQFFNELNWVKINDPQLFFTDVSITITSVHVSIIFIFGMSLLIHV